MRVKFTSPFDYVTLRTRSGTPRATVAYMPTDEPITVKREHGEAAVAAGKAVEVQEPAVRDGKAKGGVVKPGSYVIGETGGETVIPNAKAD